MEDIYSLEDKMKYIYNFIEGNKSDKISGEIMGIIKHNNVGYTTNNNGFFINLSLIDPTIIDHVYVLVHSYNINKPSEIFGYSTTSKSKKNPICEDTFIPQDEPLKLTPLEEYILKVSKDNLSL